MNNKLRTYQVAIVGGGAVGLFLGIALEQAGISSIILEKKPGVRTGSRSLGIHPVSLELFQHLGIAQTFVNKGITITKGHAFNNNKKLGTLSFKGCPKPYNYILSLPQQQTEILLEKELKSRNPNQLIRNAEVSQISETAGQVEVRYAEKEERKSITAQYLIGCDGKNSFVRNSTDIPFRGETYPDTYIMGDFTDNTNFGPEAAIFLCKEGLIESFPLIHNKRRWVVKTNHYFDTVHRKDIADRVLSRINHDLTNAKKFMLSSFGVQKFVAENMVRNRTLLAGDAAHVVSPIGGQGMNLGWLGAWDLAQCLKQVLKRHQPPKEIFAKFEERRKKAARNAIWRGEINMRVGRKSNIPKLRDSLLSLILHTPISTFMARIYTMRGIESWPF